MTVAGEHGETDYGSAPAGREVDETDLDERIEGLPRDATSGASDGSSSPRRARQVADCIAQTSARLIPLILDDRADSLSRVPPHSGGR